MIEDEEDNEPGSEEDEAISGTTTSLLSEEEYQEFLGGGSKERVCDEAISEQNGGGEDKQKVDEEWPPDSEKAESLHKAEGEGEKEKKEDVEEKGIEGKGKPPSDQAGGQESEGKVTTESTQDQPTEGDGDTLQDTMDIKGVATADDKPTTEQATDTQPGEGRSTDNPPARSALVRRLTSYGNDRAWSVSQQRQLSGMSSAHPGGPTGPGHVWDHVMLNCSQFVQLVELFLGAEPEDAIVDALSSFIRNNYTETAQVCVCTGTTCTYPSLGQLQRGN